jgi:hypothetical protein
MGFTACIYFDFLGSDSVAKNKVLVSKIDFFLNEFNKKWLFSKKKFLIRYQTLVRVHFQD